MVVIYALWERIPPCSHVSLRKNGLESCEVFRSAFLAWNVTAVLFIAIFLSLIPYSHTGYSRFSNLSPVIGYHDFRFSVAFLSASWLLPVQNLKIYWAHFFFQILIYSLFMSNLAEYISVSCTQWRRRYPCKPPQTNTDPAEWEEDPNTEKTNLCSRFFQIWFGSSDRRRYFCPCSEIRQ